MTSRSITVRHSALFVAALIAYLPLAASLGAQQQPAPSETSTNEVPATQSNQQTIPMLGQDTPIIAGEEKQPVDDEAPPIDIEAFWPLLLAWGGAAISGLFAILIIFLRSQTSRELALFTANLTATREKDLVSQKANYTENLERMRSVLQREALASQEKFKGELEERRRKIASLVNSIKFAHKFYGELERWSIFNEEISNLNEIEKEADAISANLTTLSPDLGKAWYDFRQVTMRIIDTNKVETAQNRRRDYWKSQIWNFGVALEWLATMLNQEIEKLKGV